MDIKLNWPQVKYKKKFFKDLPEGALFWRNDENGEINLAMKTDEGPETNAVLLSTGQLFWLHDNSYVGTLLQSELIVVMEVEKQDEEEDENS